MILIITLVLVTMLLITVFVVAWDKIIVGAVPFISLDPQVVEGVIANINIKPGTKVYDLGCGDGRVLIQAAKVQPNAEYVGIEKGIWPYLLAKYNTHKYSQISIMYGDVTKTELAESALVICYLLPELLAKIRFTQQQVVSVEYQIPNSEVGKKIVLKKHSRLVSKMFFYTFS